MLSASTRFSLPAGRSRGSDPGDARARAKALAVAGAALGAAAGFVFLRSRAEAGRSVHDDPAR